MVATDHMTTEPLKRGWLGLVVCEMHIGFQRLRMEKKKNSKYLMNNVY